MISADALIEINAKLFSQRFPHNMSVKFNYSLDSYSDWKAKHFRIFVLCIGLPIVVRHLPSIVASHFALSKIIHYYCQTAPQIYGATIELFSLHAHLHLPQQVYTHGGLAFTSAFCFESALRYLQKKAHGTRNLGTQISHWINSETVLPRPPFQLSKSIGVNSININNPIFDKYRPHFLHVLRLSARIENDVIMLCLTNLTILQLDMAKLLSSSNNGMITMLLFENTQQQGKIYLITSPYLNN
jgi:hypothetical protein